MYPIIYRFKKYNTDDVLKKLIKKLLNDQNYYFRKYYKL